MELEGHGRPLDPSLSLYTWANRPREGTCQSRPGGAQPGGPTAWTATQVVPSSGRGVTTRLQPRELQAHSGHSFLGWWLPFSGAQGRRAELEGGLAGRAVGAGLSQFHYRPSRSPNLSSQQKKAEKTLLSKQNQFFKIKSSRAPVPPHLHFPGDCPAGRELRGGKEKHSRPLLKSPPIPLGGRWGGGVPTGMCPDCARGEETARVPMKVACLLCDSLSRTSGRNKSRYVAY